MAGVNYFNVSLILFPGDKDSITVGFSLYPFGPEETEKNIRKAIVDLFTYFKGEFPKVIIPAKADIVWVSMRAPKFKEAQLAVVDAWKFVQTFRTENRQLLNLCFQELKVDPWDDAIINVFVDAIRRLWPSNANMIEQWRVRVNVGHGKTEVWIPDQKTIDEWRQDTRFRDTGGIPTAFSGMQDLRPETETACTLL